MFGPFQLPRSVSKVPRSKSGTASPEPVPKAKASPVMAVASQFEGVDVRFMYYLLSCFGGVKNVDQVSDPQQPRPPPATDRKKPSRGNCVPPKHSIYIEVGHYRISISGCAAQKHVIKTDDREHYPGWRARVAAGGFCSLSER